MVKEIKREVGDDKLEEALALEPESLNDAMRQWRLLSDHVADCKKTFADHEAKIIYLKEFVRRQLTIHDGENKSETISVPNAGSASKKTEIVAEVVDWESWQKYLLRHGFGQVNRHQNNIGPLQDLYDMIMDGTLPMPKSAQFKTIEKVSLRRN